MSGSDSDELDGWFAGATLLLIFDGQCGICTRFAEWVQHRDAADAVRLLPGQTPGLPEAFGLTRAAVDREAWAIDRAGRAYAGAAAVNRTLRSLGGPWALLARLYPIPPLRWLEDCGYRWFARHRGRFARWGVVPACAHPGASCGSEEVHTY